MVLEKHWTNSHTMQWIHKLPGLHWVETQTESQKISNNINDMTEYFHVYSAAYLSVTTPVLFWNSCWFKSNSRCVANVLITADSRFRAKTSTRIFAERHWSVLDMCDIICIKQSKLTQLRVNDWNITVGSILTKYKISTTKDTPK